jgi:magnesium transporter
MLVDCVLYENGASAGSVPVGEACRPPAGDGSFAWLRLHEPSEEELESMKGEFELPELAVEDALKAGQRPKLEHYDGKLVFVLKPARYVDSEEVIETDEVLVFLGEGFVISVSHGRTEALDVARARLEEGVEHSPTGPDAVLYAIVDAVVDTYEPAGDGVEVDLQQIEREVFSPGRHNAAERIYMLEQEVLDFHRAVAPLVTPLEQVASGRYPLIRAQLHQGFRDVHDHVLRARGQIDAFRELLSSALHANLTQVSIQQNDDVRRISAWVAIVAVPTMIAGIYGMNFEHMPELGWTLGYPAVIAVMVAICGFLYWRFKRAGWL